MSARLLALLGVVAIIEVVVAFMRLEPHAPAMQGYRLIHLAEMFALIALTLRQFGMQGRITQLILAGLLLSFAGDVINSFLFDLSFLLKPQTLLSIPPFVAAHLCYIAAFVILIRGSSGKLLPWGRLLLIWPVLAFALWWLVIDRSAPPLLFKLSVVYAFVVILMGLMALMLGLRLGSKAWIPALGGLTFVVSDCILGLYLLDGQQRPVLVSQAIWVTYFLAQALISRASVVKDRS